MASDKEMDVIGHKNAATYRDVVFVSAMTEQVKRFIDLRTRQQLQRDWCAPDHEPIVLVGGL